MPLSDYGNAFFFARRTRVTLRRGSVLPSRRNCHFESIAEQGLRSICRSLPQLAKYVSRRGPAKTPAPENFGGRDMRMSKKSPATAGLVDWSCLGATYFASFAI
jgi:hypothetical protein